MYDNGVGRNFESRLWLNSKNGNVTTFTQNLSGIKKPDTNLTGFIQRHSPSYKYSWSKGTTVAYQNPTLVLPTSGKKLQAPTYLQSVLEMHNNTTKASNVNISGARTTNSYTKEEVAYLDSVAKRMTEGATFTVGVGGEVVVGGGFNQSGGIARDTTGQMCAVTSSCVQFGARLGGSTYIDANVATGTLTLGTSTKSIAIVVLLCLY